MAKLSLVVCEKKSVGEAVAAILGAKNRADGHIKGEKYIVTWCTGHLVELAKADAYDEKYAKWKLEHLPIIPAVNEWKYIPKMAVKSSWQLSRS